jgi:hypothetical protein
MGDRNNIKITYSTGDSVYLYGHWIGNEIHDIVKGALWSSDRVTDESYFARVLFSRMIEKDISSDTGFGIAPYLVDQDASNTMVHVDYTQANELTQWGPAVDYDYKEDE